MANNTSLSSEEAFSSIDLVCQCLIDKKKAEAFESVFKSVLRPGYRVLDLGTGSGILALLAARSGAKEVVAVEFDPFIAKVAEENVIQNGYRDVIKVICDDARSIKFDSKERFNVITMEMLSTGLVDEFQVQAVNNLFRQGLINQDVTIIPSAQESHLSLCQCDYNNFGFEMKMVRHLWSHDHNENLIKPLSKKQKLNHVDFSKEINELFHIILSFKVSATGKLNGVCQTSKTLVNNDSSIVLESTHSLNPLVIIPLPDREVIKGEDIELEVNYKFGGGYQDYKVNYLS
jgi:predicted RNA methylase